LLIPVKTRDGSHVRVQLGDWGGDWEGGERERRSKYAYAGMRWESVDRGEFGAMGGS
jgi:hypothetical protein